MGICLSLDHAPHLPQSVRPVEVQYVINEHNSSSNNVAADKVSGARRRNAGSLDMIIFTYSDLKAATKNFRPDLILGEGGFGIVYKGVIDYNDIDMPPIFTSKVGNSFLSQKEGDGFQSRVQVAVKVLNQDGLQGDREWLAEVNYLGQLSHPNLVKLIGYCCEDDHRMLVYEYMACGSLANHLFRRMCLTMQWSTRMRIALDAAKGLAFLHGEERPVIYRDFKTSNILLDSDYTAKLSDFGLAKDGPVGDQTYVSTRVVGTDGYAAPEYVKNGHLTVQSDVYGFGVVLLEMLIGRRAMDKNMPSLENSLVEWVRPLLVHNRKLQKIIDPRMKGQYCFTKAQKVANLAHQCLSQNPKDRPTMSQVVEILDLVQEEDDNEQGLPFQRWDCDAMTLFEASTGTMDSNADKTKSFVAKAEESRWERNKVSSRWRRITGPRLSMKAESSSELPLEKENHHHQSIHSPDSDGSELHSVPSYLSLYRSLLHSSLGEEFVEVTWEFEENSDCITLVSSTVPRHRCSEQTGTQKI